MCGIFYVKRFDGSQANKMVAKRYQSQKTRGSDGFGFVALEGGMIKEYLRVMTEEKILEALDNQKATEILFHHRFPTSTPNFPETAHPIRVSHQSLKHDYYLIHNGIITNDTDLKEEHEAMGYKYTTELMKKWRSKKNTIKQVRYWNDSESLAIEMAMAIDMEKDSIPVKGSIAFICLQVAKNSRKASKLFFGRNAGNPLKMEVQRGKFIALASEGQGKMIETDKLYSFDYATHGVDVKEFEVGKVTVDYRNYDSYGFNGGAHHTTFDEYDFEDEILDLEIERDDLKKRLRKETLTEFDRVAIEEQLMEIDYQLEDFKSQQFKSALQWD